jgi:thiol:disulfide interchange protein
MYSYNISQTKKIFFSKIFLLTFILFIITSCNPPQKAVAAVKPAVNTDPEMEIKPTRVVFNNSNDLAVALQKAQKEKKVIFVDFYTTWCYPCKIMDQGAFSDWDVADYLENNCVAMKVDAEKGTGVILGTEFGIKAFPTLVFIDPNGIELTRKEGSLGIEEFKVFMKSSVWKYKGQ